MNSLGGLGGATHDVTNTTPVVGPNQRNAIIYVTDMSFALPTMAAALEVRRKTPIARADIRIVTTDVPHETSELMMGYLAPRGVMLDRMKDSSFLNFDRRFWNKTHVPISSLGRFFMLDCMPDIYDRILYLDGDTWPCAAPSALFDVELPPNTIAAAEDRSYYYRHEKGPNGRRVRAYFSGIGIDGNAGYFNAGVLLTRASTWRTLAAEAFEFFRRYPERCIYHDQSALNAVAGARRIRLAPRWNFLYSYRSWGVRAAEPPQIVHFAGGPKPWMFPPHEFFPTYRDAFLSMEGLELVVERHSSAEIEAIARDIRWQSIKLSSIFLHRKLLRASMYNKLDRRAVVS